MHSVRSRFAFVLGVLALTALAAAPAQARPADGPGRIVFVAGKSRHCHQGACRNLDVVRAISPRGGRARVLTEIRSVAEVATSDDGTVAVLSKDVAGGGANAGGRSLVFGAQVPNAHPYENALYTVHASGAARRRLTNRFEDPGLPQWTVRP